MLYNLPKSRSGWLELLTVENAAAVIAAVSFAVLAGAWAFEFADYKPCELCLQERIPFYIAVPGGLIAAYFAHTAPKVAAAVLAIVCLALVYNAGLSTYHTGAEWHFWPGPSACTGDDLKSGAPLSKRLLKSGVVRCDEPALRIFGLSLAGDAALVSAGLAAIGAGALTRRYWR